VVDVGGGDDVGGGAVCEGRWWMWEVVCEGEVMEGT